jgi:hypothetical protein
MLNPEDIKTLEAKGVTTEELEAQITRFKTGFPFLNIAGAATPAKGIKVLDETAQAQEQSAAAEYKGSRCKFVPASGAATRMFKDLFEAVDKLNAGEYKVKRESCKTDFIKLTMDKNTWQDLLNEQTDQIRVLSKSRHTCHQYSFSLIDQFETKAKSYERSGEFPNFNCQFYGEDFEREILISK